jgi:hypothetical protein
MKFAIAAIALAAGAYAQTVSQIPACALPGMEEARAKVTTCAMGDYKCLCDPSNIEKLTQAATERILTDCGAARAASMFTFCSLL